MAENEIPEPPDWSDARTFFLEPDLWHEPYELGCLGEPSSDPRAAHPRG